MDETPFSIATNIYTTSMMGSIGRHQVKWRLSKENAGSHSQNESSDFHKEQLDSPAINEIEPTAKIGSDSNTSVLLTQAQSHFHTYIKNTKRQCIDYVDTLKKAATFAEEDIKAHHLPYRFFFFKRDGEAFLDLINLDPNGRPIGITTKNVTNNDFDTLIDDVRDSKGMYIDSIG
ncbi:MAG: hypothetical protein JW863_22215 [Chitinispirillaceae bacterium]|nr:hypothetical protein [Chitinispirillaceae bacterium]